MYAIKNTQTHHQGHTSTNIAKLRDWLGILLSHCSFHSPHRGLLHTHQRCKCVTGQVKVRHPQEHSFCSRLVWMKVLTASSTLVVSSIPAQVFRGQGNRGLQQCVSGCLPEPRLLCIAAITPPNWCKTKPHHGPFWDLNGRKTGAKEQHTGKGSAHSETISRLTSRISYSSMEEYTWHLHGVTHLSSSWKDLGFVEIVLKSEHKRIFKSFSAAYSFNLKVTNHLELFA